MPVQLAKMGAENEIGYMIAGADCGFSTFAGFGAVDEDIVYAKISAMVEGEQLASDKLWPIQLIWVVNCQM